MNMLFLDPDEYYQSQYQKEFSELGEVRVQGYGQGVKEVVSSFKPHVIVSELVLPDYTIYELLEQLDEYLFASREIRIVIFSRLSHTQDVEAALKYGVTNFLVKGQD